jgi:hypothetical protein
MLLDDRPLPELQDDRPPVLSSGAMLREQDGPCVPVGIDDRDGAAATRPNRVTRTDRGNRVDDALDDVRLALVERNMEAVGPARAADVTVAQIHPEQVAIHWELRSAKQVGCSHGDDGRGGRSRTCKSLRTEDFKSSAVAVSPRPRM